MMIRSRQPLAAYRLEQMRFLHIDLERDGLAGTGERPELFAVFQHTGCFQLEATDLRQIPMKLQNFARLYDLIARGHDR